jgi:hypothetical protein
MMATTAKKRPQAKQESRRTQVEHNGEPKRLSKFALWRQENPHGIITVNDWRAVNR